jgi:PKHD-type hydroxylase
MRVNLHKYYAPLKSFCIWRDGFTPEEIEKIKFLEELLEFEKGKVGEDKKNPARKEVRDSDVSWILPNENTDWIFQRLSSIIPQVNYDHFMFNIEGFDALQYTKYTSDQHYSWHMDYGHGWSNTVRKISMVMLLNDPEDYEGGEFEIVTGGDIDRPESFKPKKGDIVFFASWMPHRVKPVISGERKSLVAWIEGKREC